MDALLFLARLTLAGVFAVAGVAKLRDRAGARQAARDFGVPERLASPFAAALPAAELLAAALLLLAPGARLGAAFAAALLLAFSAAIGASLLRGRLVRCHCFGRLSSGAVGRGALARNAALAAAALAVAWAGPGLRPGAPLARWAADAPLLAAAAAAILAAAVVAGWLLLQLVRQQGRLLRRIELLEAEAALGRAGRAMRAAAGEVETPTPVAGAAPPAAGESLAPGAAVPGFTLPALAGGELSLAALLAKGRPVALLFMDPNCAPCAELLPQVAGWQRAYADRLTVAVVSRGAREANGRKFGAAAVERVLLQQDFEVARSLGVAATPSAVLLTPQGRLARPVAEGPSAVIELVEHAAAGAPAVTGEGEVLPALTLTTLDGGRVALADALRGPSVLLFYDTRCRYCSSLLPMLREWEATDAAGADLVVVARGTPDECAALGLRAPVYLDQELAVARQLGARGTPTAVLVDADGKVASRVAAGGSAVLALLTGQGAGALAGV